MSRIQNVLVALVGIVVALVVSLAPVTTPVLTVATVVALSSPAHAQVQPPEGEGEKTFSRVSSDDGRSARQTTDGGYIVAGVTWSFGDNTGIIYLIKTDALGNLIWQKVLGKTSSDEGPFIQQTSDDGYILAGQTQSSPTGDSDAYLTRIDVLGNLVWQKMYGTGIEGAYSVQQTSDGCYVVAGVSRAFGIGTTADI